MIEREVVVKNRLGLHLRPAGELCKLATEFRSDIKICFRNREFSAKSILGILSACVQQQDEIRVVCKGPDEQEACAAIVDFIENQV